MIRATVTLFGRNVPLQPTHRALSPLASPGIIPSVRAGASVLGSLGHVCAFFQNREDEYRVLPPFIKEGFEQRDRPFHIVDPTRLDDQDDPFFVPSDEL